MKLNSGATSLPNGVAGFGFVIQDDSGDVLLSGCKRQRVDGNSTLLEAMALRFGLQSARTHRIEVHLIEMDSSNLCNALKENWRQTLTPCSWSRISSTWLVIVARRTSFMSVARPTLWHITWHTTV
ncbi:hypothetical protein ACS0TY_021342 [Phlomoides rotata]